MKEGARELCAVQKTRSQYPDEGPRQAAVEGLRQGMEGVSAAGPVRCCQPVLKISWGGGGGWDLHSGMSGFPATLPTVILIGLYRRLKGAMKFL